MKLKGTGQLYSCGSNNKGQLGLNSTEDVSVLTPVIVGNNDPVTMTTGGWDFSLAISGKKYNLIKVNSVNN
jgi:alpha-tubulin suppressor-like RCC1 family protein